MRVMTYKLKNPQEIEIFIPLLSQYLSAQGINEEQRLDIIFCLRESLNNAFLHGGKKNLEPLVKVEAGKQGNVFSFKVIDGGDALIEEKPCLEGDISEHGRGLWLMRALLDEVYLEKGAVGGKLTIQTDE